MSNLRQVTVDTYNQSADTFSSYFAGIGSRVGDIELGLSLAGNPEAAQVVEIGCGDGRDAAEIVPRVAKYQGFDISRKFVEMAKRKVPEGHFSVADAVDYDFPQGLDVVFAFASLLHLSRSEVRSVLRRAYVAQRIGGIFFASVKYSSEYREDVQTDQFGTRLFYYYSERDMQDCAGEGYETVYQNRQLIGATEWLEIAFRKTGDRNE